ncbi:unnamed protein product [Lymnaea stagnalis]|uniref:Uncharacterized protein n=1 Tax=Lymnaea stagnalis TaxID=6523 RepID=A0AAV2HLM8_LYMST
MVWEIISWTLELTFNIVCSLTRALVWTFQQTFYMVLTWVLPKSGLIIVQSISFVSSWMLPAMGWILQQIFHLVWNYPQAVIVSILGALLTTVAFSVMGLTSAGMLEKSFGAWIMSVVSYYG